LALAGFNMEIDIRLAGLLLLWVAVAGLPVAAIQADEASVESQSGYDTAPEFGGPSGVSGELREANERRSSVTELDATQRLLAPWFDWKRKLNDDHGFTVGLNAYWLYQGASGSLSDEDDAFGGIYRLQGSWVLTGRDSDNKGRLEWRIENRSKSFTELAPSALGGELGIAALNSGFGYSDGFDTDLAVINWTQGFRGDTSGVAVGRLAFDAYLDGFPFQTFSRGFINRSFVVNPTLATTGIGALGAVAKGFVSDQIWVGAHVYDANAASGDFDWDTFEQHEWLTALEVGWTPDFERYKIDRLQFTYWHKDARAEAGVPEGKGWAISAAYKASETMHTFVRAGHSDGGAGVAAENAASTGLEWELSADQFLSVGLGWAQPSELSYGKGLDDEYVFETSYKFQLSPNFSLTPDLQYVKNPAKNPLENGVWITGLRAILTL
jgi:porin